MAKDTAQLSAAKVSYKNAWSEGNRQEEARWANVIGDILKNRGEYYLPDKHLLPTCQSLDEVYLRRQQYQDALVFRLKKKHLDLAKDANDLIEQQRASTQLGWTYPEMFLKSDEDHYSVQNAKKYFKSATRLAEKLKKNPLTNKTSFEAKTMLTKGLEICDEEEIGEDDDCRTRKHIEKDIIICKRIGHCQGEAKGYINLGGLHYRIQKYDEAIRCYEKPLDLAQSMEDEDALAVQIDQNIDTVKEAIKVMEDLRKEEQNFKKLTRDIAAARGTARERKYCILWCWHHVFAKRKKRIANELCDRELRNFNKAIKWFNKSWETYNSIGNLEVTLTKINIGDVLYCDGDWMGAIASEAKIPSIQLTALENMHYSHMIRFDNVDESSKSKSMGKLCSTRSQTSESVEIVNDDVPLVSLLQSTKHSSNIKAPRPENYKVHENLTKASKKCFTSNQQIAVRRKRIRVILSDNEDDFPNESDISKEKSTKCLVEDVASNESGHQFFTMHLYLLCSNTNTSLFSLQAAQLLPPIHVVPLMLRKCKFIQHLMKLYIDPWIELSETPNMKLLQRLYISELIEDEVIASDCELLYIYLTPFFLIVVPQICECPLLFTCLEVVNLSGNRPTDTCASFLSTILENLNMERCSITSRTNQKVSFALNDFFVLAQLSIVILTRNNQPISGNVLNNLLTKLVIEKSFTELSLNGLSLNKLVIDTLCQLAKTSSFSRLILGRTGVGTEGALQITESLFRGSQGSVLLDLSFCGLTRTYIHKLNSDATFICGILELNLGVNPISEEGGNALVSFLMDPQSSLEVLILNKCKLGYIGIQLVQALAENECLQELHLTDNADLKEKHILEYAQAVKERVNGMTSLLQPESNVSETL
ncbi:hypothetical protein K2173_011419 [Erythroxylum novogranatense]|uniref:Protein TONSOKU n=1 Tax=Erythroxylum novogranatense TaxID=1862640 RepID=A0AAV8S6N3_9ROSI|nr:hypothetical protein K2173_011419 [Erythroxylum novogranatense]